MENSEIKWRSSRICIHTCITRFNHEETKAKLINFYVFIILEYYIAMKHVAIKKKIVSR